MSISFTVEGNCDPGLWPPENKMSQKARLLIWKNKRRGHSAFKGRHVALAVCKLPLCSFTVSWIILTIPRWEGDRFQRRRAGSSWTLLIKQVRYKSCVIYSYCAKLCLRYSWIFWTVCLKFSSLIRRSLIPAQFCSFIKREGSKETRAKEGLYSKDVRYMIQN